jgi:hypothetical protein
MATPTKYTYSIQNAFPNHKVATDRLTLEIQRSSIVIALDYIETDSGDCNIWFKDALPSMDVTTLDGIVATHSGEPLPSPAQLVQLDGPLEADKKPIVVVSPATQGLFTFLTGRADIPGGPGLGTPLRLDFTGPESKVLEFSFSEPIEINDGQIWWRPSASWGPDDEFSVGMRMPATVATPTPGTGNVNVVALGPGAELYVPAAGDGSHTVDLANAVPVRAPAHNGFWSVDDWTGAITPSASPGQASWNLLSFDVIGYLVRSISCGHPLGVWDIDVYKTEWIHQNWKLRFEVNKASAGAGTIGGWMLTFRETVG